MAPVAERSITLGRVSNIVQEYRLGCLGERAKRPGHLRENTEKQHFRALAADGGARTSTQVLSSPAINRTLTIWLRNRLPGRVEFLVGRVGRMLLSRRTWSSMGGSRKETAERQDEIPAGR